MAIYWNLGLRARSAADAAACADYFRAQRLIVDGREVPLEVSSWERGEGDHLVAVHPRGMNHGSPHGSDLALVEPLTRARIAADFDAWLTSAPPFAAALFAAEAYDLLLDDGEPEGDGWFVDDQTWIARGRPPEAVEVAPGRRAWPRTTLP